MAELHDLTALDQAAALRRGEVSVPELVEHYLQRIEKWSDTFGAFVTVTQGRARAQAAAAQAQLDERAADLPVLFGVPTAVKDLNLTAGVRTTFGSVVMTDFVPPLSDEVVLRLEAAGLVSLGKTNTPELGAPCYTEPEVAPPARTPFDPQRMAGGSSGGAAAAVAAGLVPLAQGSDGGGSIRIPASCCGLVGFKPSRGVVSAAPLYGDPVGLSTAGPLARTVRDAAALLDAMAGRTVGDPSWAPDLPADETFLGWCDREPGRLRVARFADPVIAAADLHPDCRTAYETTSRLLVDLGHELVDIEVPLPAAAVSTFETCWAVLTALWPVPAEDEQRLRPLTRWLRARGNEVTGPAFGSAIGQLRRVAAQALTVLAPYDAVLTPTLAQPPMRIGELRDDADPAQDFENQKHFTPYTSAWNVTGMPAVSLPLAETTTGLPIGVMLAGRPAQDHLLLALAAQLEEAAPWGNRRPPCWNS